jgi:hypothetical protein
VLRMDVDFRGFPDYGIDIGNGDKNLNVSVRH